VTTPAVEQESAYRAQTLALATLAAGEMTGALALPVPDVVFLAAGAAVVARAASRATAAADLSLAAALAEPGSPPLPLGLTPEPDTAVRARKGLATLLDTLPGDPPEDGELAAARREPITARAVRLARNESLSAGADAYAEGMTRRRVPGWVRVTGPDPCPLCTDLAARAEVLPASHRMARHVGCSCVQRPTTRRPTRGRTR
jgi:poly-gamma-glutamate capsule biosynthesis protein CapA/YwtB (metallophosphatase superfamily)